MSCSILHLLSIPASSRLGVPLFLITVERKRPVRFGSASLSPEKRLDYRAPARPDYFRIPQKSAIVF
jgi:hypothetical protein